MRYSIARIDELLTKTEKENGIEEASCKMANVS